MLCYNAAKARKQHKRLKTIKKVRKGIAIVNLRMGLLLFITGLLLSRSCEWERRGLELLLDGVTWSDRASEDDRLPLPRPTRGRKRAGGRERLLQRSGGSELGRLPALKTTPGRCRRNTTHLGGGQDQTWASLSHKRAAGTYRAPLSANSSRHGDTLRQSVVLLSADDRSFLRDWEVSWSLSHLATPPVNRYPILARAQENPFTAGLSCPNCYARTRMC